MSFEEIDDSQIKRENKRTRVPGKIIQDVEKLITEKEEELIESEIGINPSEKNDTTTRLEDNKPKEENNEGLSLVHVDEEKGKKNILFKLYKKFGIDRESTKKSKNFLQRAVEGLKNIFKGRE